MKIYKPLGQYLLLLVTSKNIRRIIYVNNVGKSSQLLRKYSHYHSLNILCTQNHASR